MLVHIFDYTVFAVCFAIALVLGYAFFKLLENTMLDFWAFLGALVVFGCCLVGLILWSDTAPAIMRVRRDAGTFDAERNAKKLPIIRSFDDCARSIAVRESHLGADLIARKIVKSCR